MKSIEKFKTFFETELRPTLEVFEARRMKICRNLLIAVICIVAVAAAVVFAVPVFREQPQFLFFVLFAGGGLAFLVYWFLTKGFILEFKQKVIARVVSFCDPSLRYAPQRHISQSEFRNSEIFQHRIDRFRGEDQVVGTVGATAVEFSEVHAEYKTTTTDSKGRRRTHWHTIFKGLFFIGDFNKHFKGQTVVLPDVAEKLFGFLGKKLQELNFVRPGDLVKLEDPEFEKEFVVYGSDQVEARYVLSTSLMRRIMDFKQKTGKKVYLSFVRSNVHVAISMTRNLFEPHILKSLLDFEMTREYLDDLELALGIVDDLNLNTRIWTKE